MALYPEFYERQEKEKKQTLNNTNKIQSVKSVDNNNKSRSGSATYTVSSSGSPKGGGFHK